MKFTEEKLEQTFTALLDMEEYQYESRNFN